MYKFFQMLNYFSDVFVEAKRVTWAKKDDVIRYSGFVIVVIFIFVVFVLCVDYVLMRAMGWVLGL